MRALTMARPSRGTDGHMTARSARRRFILGGSALLFAACAPGGAPSFDFFGAYFPAWLPFAVLAILLALLTRGLMILRDFDRRLPHPLLLSAAIGFIAAGLSWLLVYA